MAGNDNVIGDLLFGLVKDPNSVDTVATNLQVTLSKAASKAIFYKITSKVLNEALTAAESSAAVKAYVKLFGLLRGTALKTAGTFDDAVTMLCLKQPKTKNERILFRNGLPFLNGLFVAGFLNRNFFAQFAKPYCEQANNEGSVLFLFDLAKNVDALMDAGFMARPEDESDEAIWNRCSFALSKACRRNVITEPDELAQVANFLKSLENKGGWKRDKMEQAEEQVNENKQQPAILAASSVETINDGAGMESTSVDAEIAAIDCDDKTAPVGKPPATQPNMRNQLKLFPKLIKELAANPDGYPDVAFEAQHLLSELGSRRLYIDAIGEMLNEVVSIGPEIFTPFLRVLEIIGQQASVNPKSLHNLQEAVTVCCMRIEQFKTNKQVDRFCSTVLRLATEFAKLNLVQSSLFKFYVRRLVRQDTAISIYFLLRVVVVMDQLVESGFFKLTSEEVAFWKESTDRLTNASRQNIAASDLSKEISQLCQSIASKGGWQREVAPAVAVAPIVIEPSVRKRFSLSTTVNKEIRHENVALVTGNIFEDEEFRSLLGVIWLRGSAVARSIVRLLEPKLKSLAPTVFADAVELILENAIFEQVENEASLDAAAKLCIEFNKIDYGRSRDFNQELRNVCLRHFSPDSDQPLAAKKMRALLEQQLESPGITAQEQMTLSQEIGRLQNAARRKSVGCTRLVGKLFELKHLPFRFLQAFVDALLLRRSEDSSECLLELFSAKAGKDFLASEVQEKGKSEWWANLFKELIDIERQPSSSARMKAIVVEILSVIASNDSRFVAPNSDGGLSWQSFDKQLQVMLLDVTPDLLRRHNDLLALIDRVRALASDAQPDQVDRLFKIFLSKVQQCISASQQQRRIGRANNSNKIEVVPLFVGNSPALGEINETNEEEQEANKSGGYLSKQGNNNSNPPNLPVLLLTKKSLKIRKNK